MVGWFMPKITKLCLHLLKLCRENGGLFFCRTRCIVAHNDFSLSFNLWWKWGDIWMTIFVSFRGMTNSLTLCYYGTRSRPPAVSQWSLCIVRWWDDNCRAFFKQKRTREGCTMHQINICAQFIMLERRVSPSLLLWCCRLPVPVGTHISPYTTDILARTVRRRPFPRLGFTCSGHFPAFGWTYYVSREMNVT